MVSFKSKRIDCQPCLGEVLAAGRRKADCSLRVAARKTKIAERYLAALESGRFEELPGDIYAKNFVRAYARWLGVPAGQAAAAYERESALHAQTCSDEAAAQLEASQRIIERPSRFALLATPRLFRHAAVGLVALSLVVYLGGKVRAIFAPPVLVLDSPAADVITADRTVEVSGVTDRLASLAINGQPVVADDEGRFSETLDLAEGTNLIEIAAQKKHSQPSQIVRTVVVEPSSVGGPEADAEEPAEGAGDPEP